MLRVLFILTDSLLAAVRPASAQSPTGRTLVIDDNTIAKDEAGNRIEKAKLPTC